MIDWRRVLGAPNNNSVVRLSKEKSQRSHTNGDFFPLFPCPSVMGSEAGTWQEFYHERFAMAMEGNLPIKKAEQQALRESINRWLALNPDHHANLDTCPQCNVVSGVTGVLPSMQYLNAGGWTLWIHDDCFAHWLARRRQEAIAAMAGMGIIKHSKIE